VVDDVEHWEWGIGNREWENGGIEDCRDFKPSFRRKPESIVLSEVGKIKMDSGFRRNDDVGV
jgi:hypothetical protein